MTSVTAEPGAVERAPLLVLGLGNLLLTDDGVGLELLRRLREGRQDDRRVEFVDGGTQGLALLGHLEERQALLILDASALGAEPGTVHHLPDARGRCAAPGTTAHESNAADLLATADLLGQAPPRAVLVGVEPAVMRTGIGLSEPVRQALPQALETAGQVLATLLESIAPESLPCTI
jgi:hydrogenase maturation protease